MGWRYHNKPPMGWPLDLSEPINDGLVGLWLFNEGSGRRVIDLSGHGGTTDEVNVFTWGAGKYGSGLVGSGLNDQEIELPDAYKPLDGKSAFTVKALCQIVAITADYGIFYSDQHRADDGIGMWFDNAGTDHIAVVVTCSGGSTAVDTGTLVPVAGPWYDVVVTYQDGEDVKLYVDGVEDTGFDGSGPSGTVIASDTEYHIGNSSNRVSDFQGVYDHFMLWDRRLFASEIAQLSRFPFYGFLNPDEIPVLDQYYAVAGGTILPQITSAYMKVSA